MIHLDPLDTRRFQRGVEHLHDLGPRAIGEFILEVSRNSDIDVVIDTLEKYRTHLCPEMLRLVGGDRFPRRALLMVPE